MSYTLSSLDHGGPYEVWHATGFDLYTVIDRIGYNVMRDTSKTGAFAAMFFPKEDAERFAAKLNGDKA